MKLRLMTSLILGLSFTASASNGYYRSPDLHNDTVVFTAEGDLWLTKFNKRGKTTQAKRLTTHVVEERQASISNDGKQIAYVANYEGSSEVYVIGVDGGVAKRVTFENSFVKVQGWTKTGEILYSTNNRFGPAGNWTLRTVNPQTLVAKSIPLADTSEGDIDADGEMIYVSRFGLGRTSDNAKVYRGGGAGQLWSYRLGSNNEATLLTKDHIGNARRPMVYKNKLYFVSDATGNDNIWSMSLDGRNVKAVTKFKEWPVREAKLDKGNIVYQQGADIKVLNLRSGKSTTLSIDLTSDFPHLRERWINKPLKYTTSTHMGGEKEKIVITARGRVAVAGTGKIRLAEVATPADSRTRGAILSHDGKWVYAISDASGEMEIWRFAADGSQNAKQLTTDGSTMRWQLSLSPDGKFIAHDDKHGDLWLLNLENLKNKKIVSDGNGFDAFEDLVWSGDSSLLAITRRLLSEERDRVMLYSIADGKEQVLTSDNYVSHSPAFSKDGDWLYFLSERHFSARPSHPWGDRNMGPGFDRRTLVFAYSLNKEAKFPFQTPNELLLADKDSEKDKKDSKKDKKDDKKESKKDDKKNQKAEVIKVDWQGITQRLWQVPVSSGNYSELRANESYLYLLDRVSEPGTKPSLKSIKIKPSPSVETFAGNVGGYELSKNGKKMFVRKRGAGNTNLYIVNAVGKFSSDNKVNKVQTKDWQMALLPQEEWRQMFHDAWIMHRDSLFDSNLRGVDWPAIKKKYEPLLERLTDRYELNDLLGQMTGNLNALHSQIRTGDVAQAQSRPKSGSLGAALNQTAQGVKIERIYRHDPEMPARAAPLSKPGVDAQSGDIITSINGIQTDSLAHLHKQLRNQAGKQVLLGLKRGDKTVKTVVVPASRNQDGRLRYKDWVNANRIKVGQGGDIGYLHLYAMGGRDLNYFAETFYANYHKPGLIIDVRRNRGGNIDSALIEKLLRKAWSFWMTTMGEADANMQQTFRGHLVVLADQATYSDGETFVAGIKALKLGPVIGKRTSGAGVWLTDRNSLVDWGQARVAELPQFAMDGRWILEGYGVEPTIEVDNLPHATFNGKDAQLEAAINYLKDKMQKQPMPALKPKPFTPNGTPADDVL
ncbi:MAG: PD40 domain-containing protein [Algicola sp.]|nr:PD40 domain-containing protein [Algicola sp.]